MRASNRWNEKMRFTAHIAGHEIPMDAKPPVGGGTGPSPKELLLAGIGGCTGMDVIALLRKARQEVTGLNVEVEAEKTSGHPAVFSRVTVVYQATGPVTPEALMDAVTKSMTLYCGVSAMIARAAPIHYQVELNGTRIGEGQAAFPA